MNVSWTGAGVAVLCMAAGTAAGSTVIDFESLNNDEVVDNQFAAMGVDFNGTTSALELEPAGDLNPIFPPNSGDTVIFDGPTGVNPGMIRADAVGPLWASVGAYVTGNTAVTLSAFDSGGVLIDSASTPGPNFVGAGTGTAPNFFLNVGGSEIAYVEFTDNGNTFTVDDFQFTAVPLPHPAALAGLGVVGVGIVRRFRRP